MKTVRNIVKIDESRCNGCGVCIPRCAEGAIRIVDGKARLMGENLCDGLGACLGHCPMDAITVEACAADAFDEEAVRVHLAVEHDAKWVLEHARQTAAAGCPSGGGCPGTASRELTPRVAAACDCDAAPVDHATSELRHWPVQLSLVPTHGAMWRDADVLVAADCVSVAYPAFQRLLAGKSVIIACPKLDDVGPYEAKLAAIFTENSIRSVTVAHMEVPCCGGIVRLVATALARAGRSDLHPRDVTVGIDGMLRTT